MPENVMIQRLAIVFGKPDSADPVKFIAEYTRLCGGFGETTLNQAADALIRNGGRQWPTPKACVDACNDAVEAAAHREAAGSHRQPKKLMPWDHDVARSKEWARDFCRATLLGKQAFNECWGRALFDNVQSYARECYRAGRDPGRAVDYRPHQDVLDYCSRYRRDVDGLARMDRHFLLGEPLPEVSGAAERFLASKTLFKSPLPPAVSEDQFEIDQQTGAA